MRNLLIAMGLVLMLSATAAQAAYISNVAGFNYPDDISATITANLDGSSLILRVDNTSGAESYLTSLAFQIPAGLELTFNGAYKSDGVTPFVYVQNANKTYEWSFGAVSGNDAGNGDAVRPYKDSINAGLFTDKGFLGGKTALGIADGSSAIFKFTVLSGSFDGLDPFLARFQGVNIDGVVSGGSDIATPTPIPCAAWLLGSGLIGLVGLRRRFRM